MKKFLINVMALIAAGAINAKEAVPSNCQETVFSEEESGYISGYNCFYADQTILDAYRTVRQDLLARYPNDDDYQKLRYQKLLENLEVGKNRKDESGIDEFGRFLEIEYIWDKKGSLTVTITYEGGDTTLLFSRQKAGTRADIEFYIQ
ncbi:MAG: hypothetical protein LBT81_00985 [Helicobacteraceae bacterium]|jgi:hypothetical protein|nr:hypothetical protein [Helicobacteraceae bacterium]